jgi:hypothetical protein
VTRTDLLTEGVRVGPVLEALGLGAEQCVEVLVVEALHLVVLGRGQHGDAVDADLQLDVLDAALLARLLLLGLDRPGRVGDVRLAVAEQLETVAGARTVDRDRDVGVLALELLRHERADRLDRGRARDHDLARDVVATAVLARRAVAAAGGRKEGHGHPGEQESETLVVPLHCLAFLPAWLSVPRRGSLGLNQPSARRVDWHGKEGMWQSGIPFMNAP